jgi:20S proteasome alpha/beta subunit
VTVAIAVVSTDGIALAADSRTTLQIAADAPTRVLSDFTHKVFQLGLHGMVTYGWAFLDGRNIAGHVAELEAAVGEAKKISVEELGQRVAAFFGEAYDRHMAKGLEEPPGEGVDVLGFLVGGYQDGAGKVFEVLLPSRTVAQRLDSSANPGAAWRGQTDVIVRLVKGTDLGLLEARAAAASKQAHLDALRDEVTSLEYAIPFQSMNLQDAVDFAVFAIRTTIDTQRLTHGTVREPGSWPGVGGPIEIGVITPKAGFGWIQKTVLRGERPAGEAERI